MYYVIYQCKDNDDVFLSEAWWVEECMTIKQATEFIGEMKKENGYHSFKILQEISA